MVSSVTCCSNSKVMFAIAWRKNCQWRRFTFFFFHVLTVLTANGLNLKEHQLCLVTWFWELMIFLYEMNYHSPGPRDQLRCLQAWVLKKAWSRPHWKVPTTQKRNLVEKKKEEQRFSKKTNNAGVTKKTTAHHLVRFWRKSDGMVCLDLNLNGTAVLLFSFAFDCK